MFRVGVVCQAKHLLAVVALMAAVGGCGEQTPTAPRQQTNAGGASALLSSGPRLVECPTDETLSARATIDPFALDETTISIGGTSITFPVGAVLDPVSVELTIPASRYVEIRLRANDQEHFDEFKKLLAVTIDYSRCNRNDVLFRPVTVWYIDSETKQLLSPMGGIDNKLTRSITFFTDHFSGYAIAF
jgi:hypothetical protein